MHSSFDEEETACRTRSARPSVFALGAQQALGSAFALQEQNSSGLGNAYAGGAAVAEDASTVWSNPAGMARFTTIQIVASVAGIFPSAKFNDNGSHAGASISRSAAPAARRAARGAAQRCTSSCRSTRDWAFGLGVSVPFGLETEWDNDWLGRYQALQVEGRDAQRQSRDLLAHQRPVQPRRRRQLPADQGDVHQQRELFRRARARRRRARPRRASFPPRPCRRFIAATPGLDSNVDVSRQRLARGAGTSASCGTSRRDMRVGAHYRSSIKYDITGNVNFSNPTLPALPPHARADRRGARTGRQRRAVERRRHRRTSSCRRSPTCRSTRGSIPSGTSWPTCSSPAGSTHPGPARSCARPARCCSSTPENFSDTWRVSGGASYYMNDNGSSAAASRGTSRRCRTRSARRACPTPIASGSPAACSTRSRSSWKFDLGARVHLGLRATSIQPERRQHARQNGLIKGDYDANVFIVGGQVSYSF